MANLKKVTSSLAEVGKITGNVVGIANSVDSLATLATPVVEHVIENRKSLITIPELYGSDFTLGLKQAKELLDHYHLESMDVKLSVQEAKEEYRNCFDSQVVDSKPKHKQKVQPGTVVVLRYVTSEVIEESQRLFEESEKQKSKLEADKILKRSEQQEKAKEVITDTMEKTKKGFSKLLNMRNKEKKIDE